MLNLGKRVVWVAIGLLVWTIFSLADASWIRRLGFPIYDSLQRQSAPEAGDHAVMLWISEGSIRQVQESTGESWPWRREFFASILDLATELKVPVVHFDLLFDLPSSNGPEDDASFQAAIRRYLKSGGAVVFPGESGVDWRKPHAAIRGDLDEQMKYGAINVPVEDDGYYRRWAPQIVHPKTQEGFAPLGAVGFPIPRETQWLRYPSRTSMKFAEIQDAFFLFGAFHRGEALTAEQLKLRDRLSGRAWFLGVAAAGLYDLRPTPVDQRAPGVIVHYTHYLNALHPDWPLRDARAWEAFTLLIVLAGFSVIAVFFFLRPLPALASGLLIVVGGGWVAMLSLWSLGIWVNPWPLWISALASVTGALGFRFQSEWKELERLAASVESSMSSAMVELIRRGELKLSRFGERRDVAVLFSDLSGFTTLAEQREPAELVEILNLYLDECVELIFEHEGYVDKFIGDAIMALWGAPVVGHLKGPEQALRAALAYADRVDRFNSRATQKFGVPPRLLSARVGLHFGPAIVGHIGSRTRHNYTAIGDTVNLASRLESLGKLYGLDLMVSEEALLVGGELQREFYLVDEVAVKGRTQSVRVYSRRKGLPLASIEAYAVGLELYRAGRWAEAIEKFQTIGPELPPADVLRQRCQLALDQGELKAFDQGVWRHDEK